jgi:hypothetical protein
VEVRSGLLSNSITNKSIWISWLILSFTFLISQAAWAADKNGPGGWQLEQQSAFGRNLLYIDQKGIKITYPDSGANILSTPPSWDVLWFNTKSHKQCFESLAHFRVRRAASANLLLPPKFVEKQITYAGMKSRKIQVPEDFRLDVAYLGRFKGSDDKFTLNQSDYFVSSKSNELPKGGLDFLSTVCGMPNFGGIPLAVHQHFSSGRVIKVFYTLSCVRKPLLSSIFVKPRGYSPAATPQEIYMGGLAGRLEDMYKGLELGKPFGH